MARDLAIHVPFRTLLKIALTFLLIVIVIKLWPVILMLVISVLIAVMLDPLSIWLQERKVRRTIAIALIVLLLLLVLGFFFGYVIPTIVKEVGHLVKDWPEISKKLAQRFPFAAPVLSQKMVPQGSQQMLGRGMLGARFVIEAVAALVFVFVVAVYLLIEGRRAYLWLASFAPPEHRKRLDQTVYEMADVVLAYMRGQMITSAIGAAFAFVFLLVLKVPMPLLLAVLAFVCDFIPIIGMIVMTSAAALAALIESPTKALIVVAGYMAYQAVENYFIVPKVYGKQMRLSTLAVVLAVAIGGTLQGVIGAIIAMPIAAAYPIIERIWLRRHLPEDTVPRHQAIENAPST